MKKTVFHTCILILLTNSCFAQTWIQLSDFPSTERDDGVSFVIDDKAYCGSGLQVGWSTTKDFYRFDFTTEIWTAIAALPTGKERQYACAFSYNGYGFVFGGTNATTLNDLWMYHPATNSWQEKKAKPGLGLSGATCFVIDSFAYFVGGANAVTNASDELWRYDCKNNSWQQMNNTQFGGRWRASATATNGKGYLIFGKDSNEVYHNQFYKYNPKNDSWNQLASFPNNGRTYSSLQSVESNLVVLGGMDSLNNYYNDLWYYDFSANQWFQKNAMPAQGRKGGMCFNSYSTLYYTTGIDQQNTRLKQTWKIENPTALENLASVDRTLVFPNPCSDKLHILFQNNEVVNIELIDLLGNTKLNEKSKLSNNNILSVDVSNISNGLFMLVVSNEKLLYQQKVLIAK